MMFALPGFINLLMYNEEAVRKRVAEVIAIKDSDDLKKVLDVLFEHYKTSSKRECYVNVKEKQLQYNDKMTANGTLLFKCGSFALSIFEGCGHYTFYIWQSEPITGKRLILTEGKFTEIAVQSKAHGDNYFFAYSRSDDDTKNKIGAHGNTYTAEKVGEFMPIPSLEFTGKKIFSVINKETGEYLGDIRLTRLSDSEFELGIVIVKAQRCKGYGSDAIKALVNYAISKLGAQKVWLRVYRNNKRAYNLYTNKLGFIYDRTEDDNYIIDGTKYLEDWLYYSR